MRALYFLVVAFRAPAVNKVYPVGAVSITTISFSALSTISAKPEHC